MFKHILKKSSCLNHAELNILLRGKHFPPWLPWLHHSVNLCPAPLAPLASSASVTEAADRHGSLGPHKGEPLWRWWLVHFQLPGWKPGRQRRPRRRPRRQHLQHLILLPEVLSCSDWPLRLDNFCLAGPGDSNLQFLEIQSIICLSILRRSQGSCRNLKPVGNHLSWVKQIPWTWLDCQRRIYTPGTSIRHCGPWPKLFHFQLNRWQEVFKLMITSSQRSAIQSTFCGQDTFCFCTLLPSHVSWLVVKAVLLANWQMTECQVQKRLRLSEMELCLIRSCFSFSGGPSTFSLPALGLCLSLFVVLQTLGISLSYHRHLTHRSFQCHKYFESLVCMVL